MQGGSRALAGMSRERARMAILEEADIVCSTLSFAGSGTFERMSRPFDVVVIDEAAQAVEPSTLVPLALGCQQVRPCRCTPVSEAFFALHHMPIRLGTFKRMTQPSNVFVIDEAAQAVERSVLIPLALSCQQVCALQATSAGVISPCIA